MSATRRARSSRLRSIAAPRRARAPQGAGQRVERRRRDAVSASERGVIASSRPCASNQPRAPLRDRRARSAMRRGSPSRHGQSSDTINVGELRVRQPCGRQALALPSLHRLKVAASSLVLRAAADAGLFNSCARPAASLPSESSFSSCRSLDVKWRARSSMACTSTAVTRGHSRIISGMRSR